MALRDILIVPDPILTEVSERVDVVDDDLRALMDDMLETMYAAPGIGLAAIQIGVPKRVIVMDLARQDEEPQPRYFVNPEILWASEETQPYEEGCLSVPGLRGWVPRWTRLRYTGFDASGAPIDRIATGFHARVVQHECDHLDGILYPMRVRDFSRLGFTDVLFPDGSVAADD